MEVDRIWRIDGLDGKADPAWQNSARRRRRFVEEVPPAEGEPDAEEEESAGQDQPGDSNSGRISVAEDSTPDSPPNSDDSSFRVIA
jgi:hypothetical protein